MVDLSIVTLVYQMVFPPNTPSPTLRRGVVSVVFQRLAHGCGHALTQRLEVHRGLRCGVVEDQHLAGLGEVQIA